MYVPYEEEEEEEEEEEKEEEEERRRRRRRRRQLFPCDQLPLRNKLPSFRFLSFPLFDANHRLSLPSKKLCN
jgi:hypothetical protein